MTISELCHTYREPVFLTKDGEGDLAVKELLAKLDYIQENSIAATRRNLKKQGRTTVLVFLPIL